MSFLVFGSIPLGALLAGALGDTLTVRAAPWVTLTTVTAGRRAQVKRAW